jgi:hypothetical protein
MNVAIRYRTSFHLLIDQVVTEATVSRVLFDRTTSDDDDLTAIGAEFIFNGKTYTVKCNKEVILSAGFVKRGPGHRT